MFQRRQKVLIATERLILRPPHMQDFQSWTELRGESRDFLEPWEPAWSRTHLTRASFVQRVNWAQNMIRSDQAVPLLLIRRQDQVVVGGVTLGNIRRAPAHSGNIGYWIGECYARQGYMTEAIGALVHHAFSRMDLSRLEAACLPENTASRGLLEKAGFKYEGVAQSYLEINGRWRNHVLYASLRMDRRGRIDSL